MYQNVYIPSVELGQPKEFAPHENILIKFVEVGFAIFVSVLIQQLGTLRPTTAFKTLKCNVNLSFKLVLWPPRCSSSAETIVVPELKSMLRDTFRLNEFMSFWRRENTQSGVVYKTRTVLRIPLELQIIHSLCFSWRIILFWSLPRRRS